jgi:MFS family permease
MAQLTPVQLLLPRQVSERMPGADWTAPMLTFGVISAASGLCALVVFPITGALSDRTMSRFGRRRPWIVLGTAVFAISLVFLGFQHTLLGIGVLWSLAMVGFSIVAAALTAVIADQVPVASRGVVSGWISAPQAIGTIVGLGLVLTVFRGPALGYGVVAVLLVVLVIPFLRRMPDAVLRPEHNRTAGGPAPRLKFWVNLRVFPDFGWTMLSRTLVSLSNALGTTLLFFFVLYGLDRAAAAEADLVLLTLIYLVFFTGATVAFGRASDVMARRKPFIYLAAYTQAFAALLLALVPDLVVAVVAAGLLGLGYGCFMSVSQALATEVLPVVRSRAKDLGFMNVASVVPQALGPLLGALIVVGTAGFSGLFLAAAITAALGGLAAIPIRGVA